MGSLPPVSLSYSSFPWLLSLFYLYSHRGLSTRVGRVGTPILFLFFTLPLASLSSEYVEYTPLFILSHPQIPFTTNIQRSKRTVLLWETEAGPKSACPTLGKAEALIMPFVYFH